MKFEITLDDLRALKPCYEPASILGKNWRGTLIDILNDCRIPDEDKIWAVTRLLDERTARLFAVHCARESLKHITGKIDDRIIQAINVAERFANGEATEAERASAADAAAIAAAAAAGAAAARAAAWSAAAYDAAWSAAYAAAGAAAARAAAAAYAAAAYAAAYDAASGAAYDAASAAAYDAASAAAATTWSAFVQKLKEMILESRATKQKEDSKHALAQEVLKYFGSKLKSPSAKQLYEKALKELER